MKRLFPWQTLDLILRMLAFLEVDLFGTWNNVMMWFIFSIILHSWRYRATPLSAENNSGIVYGQLIGST